MSVENIDAFIKYLGINICMYFSYFKILNNNNSKIFKLLFIIISSMILSCFESIYPNSIYTPLKIVSIYTVYGFVLSIFHKNKIGITLITLIISLSIGYIGYSISSFIVYLIATTLYINFNNPIIFISTNLLQIILTYSVFKINRLKNGLLFIKNKQKDEYFELFVLIISTIIIFTCFIAGNYARVSLPSLTLGLLLFIIFLVIVLQKTLIIYQNHRVMKRNIIDYEQELSDTKQKLSTAIEEKQKLVQSNHEFYHRQEALNKKLNDLLILQSSTNNTEFSAELTDITTRINQMSNEYNSKTQTLPHLVKCGITEIDDMLSYMQLECSKNNIEFLLKIDCDINYIVDNFISKSKLETLLGDLIRNAIIAINHSSEEFRSIMVVMGIKDDSYELCIYDSGIPFEINTLLNLGLKPSSTHLDEGGTGIGFITTFETINSCNASLIINELTNTQYTKSLEIKFDNKHQYIVISNRKHEINHLNSENRNIILM